MEFSPKDFEKKWWKVFETKKGKEHRAKLEEIWNREVEKAKNNQRDDRKKNSEKITDPWENDEIISILFDENGDEILPNKEIPAGEIEIVFGKNFSWFDVPDLILQIQNLRNKFYENQENVEPEKRKLFKNLGKAEILLSDFTQQIAVKYEQLWFDLKDSPNKIEAKDLRKILQILGEFNFKFHQLYGTINLNNLDFASENFREEILEIIDEKNSGEKIPEILQNQIKDDFYGTIQKIGEKELLRATEFTENLAENFAGKKFAKIQKIYKKKYSDLKSFKNPFSSIQDAQNQLKNARKQNDKNTESKILQNIFRVVNVLIFSEKIIPYKAGNISFNEIARDGTGNCMLAWSVVPHIFLGNFFGVETKQIETFEHSILGAILPGNRIWNFEENKMTDLENKNEIQVNEKTGEWFLPQDFKIGNIAASLSWQRYDFKHMLDKIKILQNAVALSLQSPNLRNNLGFAFLNFALNRPGRKKEYLDLAEAEFKKAVELTRGVHADYLFVLFNFYKNNLPIDSLDKRKKFEKMKKAAGMKKQILELVKNRKNVTVAPARKRHPEIAKEIFGG